MRANRHSWLVALFAGMLIGALAVGLTWFVGAGVEEERWVVDAGSYEDFVSADDFSPVLFARDDFYFVRTEAGEPIALYVYPPIAQQHQQPGCAVLWQEAGVDERSEGVFRDRCYGATFTRDGAWVSGPSSRGLDQFPIVVEGGRILVDTRRLVCDGSGECGRL